MKKRLITIITAVSVTTGIVLFAYAQAQQVPADHANHSAMDHAQHAMMDQQQGGDQAMSPGLGEPTPGQDAPEAGQPGNQALGEPTFNQGAPQAGRPENEATTDRMPSRREQALITVRPDSPEAVLALKRELNLSREQVRELTSISEQARRRVRQVLSESQNRALGDQAPVTARRPQIHQQRMGAAMPRVHPAQSQLVEQESCGGCGSPGTESSGHQGHH